MIFHQLFCFQSDRIIMSIVELNEFNFERRGTQMCITIPGNVLVFFKTSTCKGCIHLQPVFEQLCQDPRILCCMLNVGNHKDVIRMSYKTLTPIRKVPHIIHYFNFKPKFVFKGCTTLRSLTNFIDKTTGTTRKELLIRELKKENAKLKEYVYELEMRPPYEAGPEYEKIKLHFDDMKNGKTSDLQEEKKEDSLVAHIVNIPNDDPQFYLWSNKSAGDPRRYQGEYYLPLLKDKIVEIVSSPILGFGNIYHPLNIQYHDNERYYSGKPVFVHNKIDSNDTKIFENKFEMLIAVDLNCDIHTDSLIQTRYLDETFDHEGITYKILKHPIPLYLIPYSLTGFRIVNPVGDKVNYITNNCNRDARGDMFVWTDGYRIINGVLGPSH